jgi:V/A-type H+-transporting ATPase subunit D
MTGSAQRPPTREQLLDVRKRRSTVQYGKQLLEKKRDALLRSIEEDRRRFRDLEREFRERTKRLSVLYALVRMYDGASMMQLLRMDAPEISVSSVRHSLMGCHFVQFMPESANGNPHQTRSAYDPALTSLYVDDLLREIGSVDALVWQYVNLTTKLSFLEKELRKTLMKINTLQYVLLPELARDETRIRAILSERERQERFSIKRLSSKKKAHAVL